MAARDPRASFGWLGWRVLALVLIALALLLGPALPPSGTQGIRRAGFTRAADRMAPLVTAIQRFDRDMGRPPNDLREMVPQYLATLQPFGVRGCRSLQYGVAPADAAWRWELRLECPNGWLNLDQFFYRPTGDYPRWKDLERVGDWAYYWD